MNFDLFKPEKKKLFVYIPITLNADSVAPKVSFECCSIHGFRYQVLISYTESLI